MHRQMWTLLCLAVLSLLCSTALAQPAYNNSVGPTSKRSTTNALKARSPQPSRRMGKRASTQSVHAVTKKDYSAFLCPDKAIACPVTKPGELRASVKESQLVTLKDWFKAGFECLDTKEELSSCGGCSSLGKGQDCTLIPNARDVGCEAGSCLVLSCKDGWLIGRDGKSCVKRAGMRR